MKVTNERFIAVWNAAADVSEVAAATGLTYGSCRYKAYWLRQRGHVLKNHRLVPMPVTRRLFITVWQSSRTVPEAAMKLGVNRRRAFYLATCLRREGVPLKWMARQPRKGVASSAR